MFDTQSDPLGIGLMARASQKRWKSNLTGGMMPGPLPDPQWDAYSEAFDEAGLDKNAQGHPLPFRVLPSGPGNEFNRSALQGLQDMANGQPYESFDDWRAKTHNRIYGGVKGPK